MRKIVSLAVVLFAAIPFTSTASSVSDSENVRRLIEYKCGGCHIVGVRDALPTAPTGAAPHFAALAHDPGMTVAKMRRSLRLPTGSMVNVLLTERDIDDIISYIVSLKQQ